MNNIINPQLLDLITRQQAADILGVTLSGIDYLRRNGRRSRSGKILKLTPYPKGKLKYAEVIALLPELVQKALH